MVEQYSMRLTMLVRCILGVYTDVCQHSDPDVSITYGECNGHSHRRACCVDTRHSVCSNTKFISE